ncbi:MAG: molybdopterin-dependent oxidoreductase [Planctomycetaceae bacterium]
MSSPTFSRPLLWNRRDWLRWTGVAAAAGLVGGPFARGEQVATVPGLKVHTEVPLNAEPPLDRLIQHWITPIENFYVRSHAPNPEVDRESYRLTVEGLVERPQSLSLAALNDSFRRVQVTATMCCADNRRDELSRIQPIEGVQWEGGPLGNAVWGGVRLADVLRQAGLRGDAAHVWFEGLDVHEKKGEAIVFGGSIPLERALESADDAAVLIADEMNGAPLNGDHGAPLRTVVPGYIGARSVKWLSKITLSDRPTSNYYVKDAYRLVNTGTPEEWARADILYSLPLQSVICSQSRTTRGDRPTLTVSGYAVPMGDGPSVIERVEVSTNGGRTWHTAQLDDRSQPYCWRFWKAVVPFRADAGQITVRAIDSKWRTQPAEAAWNLKGYMHNSWHSVDIATP